MNGVEYRNLCDLAENCAIGEEDRKMVQRILSWRFGLLTDADIAAVSLIRAKAARPDLPQPELPRAA